MVLFPSLDEVVKTFNKSEAGAKIARYDQPLPLKGQAVYVNLGMMERIETGYMQLTITKQGKMYQFRYHNPVAIL